MSGGFDLVRPLPGAGFGGILRLQDAAGAAAMVAAAERAPEDLPRALAACGGVLLLPGMQAMAERPELLLRLSRLFGPEVENYRETGMAPNMVHPEVPEIFVVSNIPPVLRAPPPLPEPPLTAEGRLPVQYPHRRGWHTDQSYRRPPPDVSLFLGVEPVPQGQGQTLFADATAAYAALPEATKRRIEGLEGLHVGSSAKRRRQDVLAGETPRPLRPHERPQRQPVVRLHPVTGRPALYLCEYGQMDWLEGPFLGLEPGPTGEGAALLDELMAHVTRPEFVYVHEWTPGDLVIWDNRCTLHAATWFDAERLRRVMWRTTVSGNPGPAYAGEARSWLAVA
ncbi:TauD/TfdA dioxygenase family protein [Paracraurococcus lichenis]|uniref:TauD/TfdA family dioxygenase n=1 Tax=Paracraurococcus lichenis TaxID=3064888 RepID=A0ABT9DZ51_9PROT|nr:TauD/TfdA family dioxygenase [Paracraurococcus sp. LOR1-02]MDO9709182.1 TauD/TfdA family dioxygenase [Paracraurococcus sp. LOR1-02]